jgi:hypothetical protein
MTYTSRSEHERHEYIDDRLERARDILEVALTDDGLFMRSFGETARRLLLLTDSLYIPNVRSNGRLSTPKQYQNDTSIPVFALNDAEEIYVNESMTKLHATQVVSLRDYADTRDLIPGTLVDSAKKVLHEAFEDTAALNLGRPSQEKVVTMAANIQIGNTSYEVLGRPAIILRTREFDTTRIADRSTIRGLSYVDSLLTKEPVKYTKRDKAKKSDESKAKEFEQAVSRATFPFLSRRNDY